MKIDFIYYLVNHKSEAQLDPEVNKIKTLVHYEKTADIFIN